VRKRASGGDAGAPFPPARAALLLAATVICGNALAAGNADRGRELAVECAACHGPDGNSPSPIFPRLAGQHEEYLLAAMQSYRDSRRADPIMRAAMQNVTDADLPDLAAWFAAQKPAVGVASAVSATAIAAAGSSVGPAGTAPDNLAVGARAPTDGCPDAAAPGKDSDGDGVSDADDAGPRDAAEFARDSDGDGAFEVCTIGQLQAIGSAAAKRADAAAGDSAWLGRNYELVADLDAGAIANFMPVGNCGPENSCMKAGDQFGYAGSFEGHGHVVRNLVINRPEAGGVGLFGVIRKGASVSNIRIENARIVAGNGAGALVGANFGTISNAEASGTVAARAAAGVLVGGSAGTVVRGRARGAVSGEAALGGLIGDMRGIVTDSWADAAVTGTRGIGGLVGLNTFGRVLNSYAIGPVTGAENTGGLVGMNTDALIERSFATGPVVGAGSNAGGLVGFNSLSRVRSSYATGNVTGKAAAGSLAGRSNGEISQSFATGAVNAATGAGPLVGDASQGTIAP
jgi:cytochrome c553